MPHQYQPRVRVCLAPVPAPKPERRRHTGGGNPAAEAREVCVAKLVFCRPVQRPQVADAVKRVEDARAAPVLR